MNSSGVHLFIMGPPGWELVDELCDALVEVRTQAEHEGQQREALLVWRWWSSGAQDQ